MRNFWRKDVSKKIQSPQLNIDAFGLPSHSH